VAERETKVKKMTAVATPAGQLLLQPRAGRHETTASYLRRLLDANHLGAIAEGSLRFQARSTGEPTSADERLVRELCSVRPWQLEQIAVAARGENEHSCPRCLLDMDGQYECRLCTFGAAIAQHPHTDGFVCERHRVWTGPRTTTAAQWIVSDAVVRAHIHWRHLRGRDTISVATTVELMAVLKRWAVGTATLLPADQQFLLAVRLWSALLQRSTLRVLTAPDVPFAAAYGMLQTCVASVLGADHPTVVDGIWCLLRPVFLFRREQLYEIANDSNWDPHAGALPRADHAVDGPLERFSRFNEQLRTCARNRWQDFLLRSLAPTEEACLREAVTRGSTAESTFICPQGHRNVASAAMLHDSHANRYEGCGRCARIRVDPGITSLDVTHREVARRWAFDLNGSTTPRDVLFGTDEKYVWRCDAGHVYEASVNSQTRAEANGCPYCMRRRAWPGETGIDPARPDMLQRWDHDKNSVTPDRVLPHSAMEFSWICPSGHRYRSIAADVADGGGCGVCRGRQILAGVNDLASQRPDIACEWHPTRNGTRRPRHVYVNTRSKAWWRCHKGHEWRAEVAKRTLQHQGCPACAVERSRVRAGVNSLADVRPDLAAQWVKFLNGSLLPTAIGIGDHRVVWWRCPNGHTFPRGTAVRVRKPACPYCENKWVLPGVNDVATRYPQIVADWSARNRPAIATLPGNARRFWVCRNGHKAFETVPNRIKTHGCPKCPRRERAAYQPVPARLGSAPYLRAGSELLPNREQRRPRMRSDYPYAMTRPPRATPAELAPEPWPEAASDDPVAEAVRRFVIRLKAEIGDRSVRSVASIANVDHGALLRVLAGKTWPDLATLARLEIALHADLWARVED